MIGFKKEDDSVNDLNIVNPQDFPGDTITSLTWAPNTNCRLLACAGWDAKIRIYDTVVQSTQKGLVLKSTLELEDPCLSTSWTGDMSKLFTGGVNSIIKGFDLNSGQSIVVGKHDAAVKDVYWMDQVNMLCSLGFDKTMRFWDLRQNTPAANFDLGHKVFCSDMNYPNLVLGLSDSKLLLIHIPNIPQMFSKPLEFNDSPLGTQSQLTAVSFFNDGSGMGCAANDGRANLSTFSADKGDRIKLDNIMTFKCHKTDAPSSSVGASQWLYPVHGIGFHPNSKSFVYTAGGEGNLFYWDFAAKNKIKGFNFKGAPINKVKISPDGALMAYSLGYDWARGAEGHLSVKPKVCVHMMQEDELTYKTAFKST